MIAHRQQLLVAAGVAVAALAAAAGILARTSSAPVHVAAPPACVQQFTGRLMGELTMDAPSISVQLTYTGAAPCTFHWSPPLVTVSDVDGTYLGTTAPSVGVVSRARLITVRQNDTVRFGIETFLACHPDPVGDYVLTAYLGSAVARAGRGVAVPLMNVGSVNVPGGCGANPDIGAVSTLTP